MHGQPCEWSKTGSQILKISVIILCNICCSLLIFFFSNVEWDPYCKVKSMLENLKLQDLFQKFFDNCIRVSFLLIFGALLSDAGIYHINYGFTRGFPALRKAVNNTLGKISYLFTCVWYCQSAADTSLAFRATRSGWWMNSKAFTILNPRFFVGMCSDYGCLQTVTFKLS